MLDLWCLTRWLCLPTPLFIFATRFKVKYFWIQCSESSGSYKTAEERSPAKLLGTKYYSDISIESTSNALDLSTKNRPKRLTTITLSSTDDDADACGASIRQRISETQFPRNPRILAGNLNLNLQVVCLLGTGGYGKVFLVRSKENLNKYYDEETAKTSESSVDSGIYTDPEPVKGRRKRGKDSIQYVRNTGATNDAMVRKVRHDPLNYYALKVIKKSNVLKSQTDLRHLKMEQRILARIQVRIRTEVQRCRYSDFESMINFCFIPKQ